VKGKKREVHFPPTVKGEGGWHGDCTESSVPADRKARLEQHIQKKGKKKKVATVTKVEVKVIEACPEISNQGKKSRLKLETAVL